MAAKKKGSELETLFPEKTIHGIVVRPIALDNLPKVIDAFGRVLQLADKGVPYADIALQGLRELLIILPYCIDCPPEEVPSTVVPELIGAVLDQNLTEDSVGKWMSLLERANALRVDAGGKEKSPPSKG